MTTSINTILKNRKNRKNKKGFSLVELIVVLVIMAILAAALVPTLIGYIKQTRQSNSKNEAAMAVSAAQTIASSAYADSNGVYTSKETGKKLTIYPGGVTTKTYTEEDDDDFMTVVETLSEVKAAGGNVTEITITDGVVTGLKYHAKNGDNVIYDRTNGYSIS